jgi:RNA polymerase sigma factor (sigma-70 family)
MAEATTLETLARRAVDGDRDAVAELVRRLEPTVHGLALRMLWHREDAEDATQEILVRVVTRLSQFDFQSQLKTWAFRVATNYLLDVKKSCVGG